MTFHLEQPIIYLITKGEATEANYSGSRDEILEILRVAVNAKVSLVQIREKQLSAKSLFDLTEAAVEITSGSATRLLVNDRADIALAANADGVHLTRNSLPVDVIINISPPDFIIGVSAHSLEAVVSAAMHGADFAVFGPVFETPGKGSPHGLATLSEICSKAGTFPVIGLGGIDESNFESVLAAGTAGIAAIRAFDDTQALQSIVTSCRA